MHVRAPMSSAAAFRPATRRSSVCAIVRIGLTVAAALVLLTLAATSASAFLVERASVASDGSESDMSSTTSALSADGRFVAFISGATNLVPGDTNFVLDAFVRDRATGTTERVSVSSAGVEATAQSATPAVSADGRYVAFASSAGNLVAGDGNGRFDVFVRDRVAGTTERVSVGDGGEGNGDSVAPAISADGRWVAFASAAGNLVASDDNNSFDIFLRDRVALTTVRVSVASDGAQSNSLSLAPRISGDGGVVVFHSFASNLVAGDTNNVPDVFAHDMATGATVRASVSSSGGQGNQQSVGASVSADGRWVGFDSDASTLVAGDVNGRTDVFVYDLVGGTTERVSVATDGTEGNNRSGFLDPPSLSADGRFVAFTSGASNMVPNDTNNVVDVMLRDRASGTTIRVNLAADGTEADGASTLWPSVSGDGSVVAFASLATNLVADDLNFVQDVFVYVDTCGNGTLDVGESCDDGNRADGDCCSSTCSADPEGGACDDGDLCTRSDACDANGVCVGSDPVVCEGGSGQCGSAATCDPDTGDCVGGPLPDGSACDDGDPCTVEDSCLDGVCEPGDVDPAACVSAFQCYAGISWRKSPWWFSSSKVLLEDRFEAARYHLGATRAVCSALSPPENQDATRMVCVNLKPAVTTSTTKRTASVVNAFGTHKLSVGQAKSLCMPTGNPAPPPEPGLDTFKCYDAKALAPGFKPVTTTLSDEFGSGRVTVLGPDKLCNPASVDGSGVLHVDAHLVCYRIIEHFSWGRFDFFRPRNVTVASHWGNDLVTLLLREHVCVPSLVTTP